MNKNDALNRLRALEPELRLSGLASLYLFGSLARDEAGSGSDVDLYFERQPGRRLGSVSV